MKSPFLSFLLATHEMDLPTDDEIDARTYDLAWLRWCVDRMREEIIKLREENARLGVAPGAAVVPPPPTGAGVL